MNFLKLISKDKVNIRILLLNFLKRLFTDHCRVYVYFFNASILNYRLKVKDHFIFNLATM